MTRPVVVVTKPGSRLPATLSILTVIAAIAGLVWVGWWVWEQAITPLLTVLVWLNVIVQP